MNKVADSDVEMLPDDCVRCEYLKSSGHQYINTLHVLEDDFIIEVEYEEFSSGRSLYGGKSGNIRDAILYADYAGMLLQNIGEHGSVSTPFRFSGITTGRHTYRFAVSDNIGSAWVDGTIRYDNVPFTGSYLSGIPMYLFAANVNGSAVEHNHTSVYSFSISQGGEKVLNFVPILDPDGKPCMYDTVSKMFFYNLGNGQFQYKILEQ